MRRSGTYPLHIIWVYLLNLRNNNDNNTNNNNDNSGSEK